MILKASQRGNGAQLARHLMNDRDNDHVSIHEMRGFVSEDLKGAFQEIEAVSRGTRCKQYLFSLSLNPPETEEVSSSVFEHAINRIEGKLGLTGQPRVIVFHEKEGRRHAHCVWSRIDVRQMKAVNLSFFKTKLQDIGRELYRENNWDMPDGFKAKDPDKEKQASQTKEDGLQNPNKEQQTSVSQKGLSADPLNFSLAEWQQAKRSNRDPKVIKAMLQECWHKTDSTSAFIQALEAQGYCLAKGDRRGHVVVDGQGEIYALSRAVGIKAKEVKDRLGDPEALPSVSETKARLAQILEGDLKTLIDQEAARYETAKQAFEAKRQELLKKQKMSHKVLEGKQLQERIAAARTRSRRLPTGLRALWAKLSGQYHAMEKQNIADALELIQEHKGQRDTLITLHLLQRRQLQHDKHQLYLHHSIQTKAIQRAIGQHIIALREQEEHSGQKHRTQKAASSSSAPPQEKTSAASTAKSKKAAHRQKPDSNRSSEAIPSKSSPKRTRSKRPKKQSRRLG